MISLESKAQMKNEVCKELNRFYNKKLAQRAGFSKRAFAKAVGLSTTFVHDILSGKKLLPAKHLEKFVAVLEIDFLTALKLKRSYLYFEEDIFIEKHLIESGAEVALALTAQNEVLRNWYFLPMLELMAIENFDGNFSDRLKISRASVDYALKRMRALGLIQEKNGKWRKTNRYLKYISAATHSDFRSFHKSMMNRAIEELSKTDEASFSRRMITTATVTVDMKKVSAAKERIANFLEELSRELAADAGEEVYSLGLQFFPLTSGSK